MSRPSLVMPLRAAARYLHSSRIARDPELGRLKELMSKFQDPSSPFYMAPGEVGPSSPDDHSTSRPLPGSLTPKQGLTSAGSSNTSSYRKLVANGNYDKAREAAHLWFNDNAFDSHGRIEWPVAWGECDMFRHINNVHYVRWFESARIHWVETLTDELGAAAVDDMLAGRHTGIILKDLSIRYRYPVTYPDTLLWAIKPHKIDQARASFGMAAAAWSLKANALAATADCTMVVYDYDTNRKGVMTDEIRTALESRGGPVS